MVFSDPLCCTAAIRSRWSSPCLLEDGHTRPIHAVNIQYRKRVPNSLGFLNRPNARLRLVTILFPSVLLLSSWVPLARFIALYCQCGRSDFALTDFIHCGTANFSRNHSFGVYRAPAARAFAGGGLKEQKTKQNETNCPGASSCHLTSVSSLVITQQSSTRHSRSYL